MHESGVGAKHSVGSVRTTPSRFTTQLSVLPAVLLVHGARTSSTPVASVLCTHDGEWQRAGNPTRVRWPVHATAHACEECSRLALRAHGDSGGALLSHMGTELVGCVISAVLADALESALWLANCWSAGARRARCARTRQRPTELPKTKMARSRRFHVYYLPEYNMLIL